MKLALVLAASFALGLSLAPPAALGGEAPEWLGDLDRAFALAEESGRPILLVFR